MKILVLSFYFEPDLCAGSFRNTSFVKTLLEKYPAASVEVITTSPNRYSGFTVEAPALEEWERLTIHRVPLPSHKSGMKDQSVAFFSYARGAVDISAKKKFDIVFASSSRLMTAALAAYISQRAKLPLYLDIRDIFVDTIEDILPRYLSFILVPLFKHLEKWTITKASKVNLVSAGFLSYFKNRFPSQTYSIFTNGIDGEFLDAAPRALVSLTNQPLQVLYAGNIGDGQGLDAIIPELANRMLEKINVTIIGDGSRVNTLVGTVREFECDNVRIMPPMSRNDLIKAYQNADILFLHLNDYQAFKKVLPSKIFEYASTGKPIWAGVDGYAKIFLEENVDNVAVFEPCNVDSAITSFAKINLVSNPRSEFCRKFARENIEKHFAEDLIGLFR